MQASLSDTINLGASIVTILGGISTTVGFIRKMTTPPPPDPHTAFTAPPAQGYPSAPAQGYPPPPQGYRPPAPGYAPPVQALRPPVIQRARRIPHVAIWGFAALGVACVVGYFLVLLFQYSQTRSTDIAVGSPLYALNAVLYAGDIIGGLGATIGLVVSAAHARMWGWLATGVFGLGVVIVTAGILSIVGLVPAAFYALFVAPRQAPQLPWRLV